MIPVRNGARDLQLCLDSLGPLSAEVIALDDGSTDETRAILEAHPIVRDVLENPRRDTYDGWDDAQNRTRLLRAACDAAPTWIFWIDADEVLPESDAARLAQFLRNEAVPDAAYGLEMHRMIDDMAHFDKASLYNYRIFGFAPGQRLSRRRLHFTPVPTSIDRSRWIRTRFRLMHRAGMTDADRRARYEKYQIVDPDNRWQASYKRLLDKPKEVKQFTPLDLSRDILVDRERFQSLYSVGDK